MVTMYQKCPSLHERILYFLPQGCFPRSVSHKKQAAIRSLFLYHFLTMRRFLLPILLLPVFAFALDYDDRSDSYTDSTAFSSEESVAIGVLTNEGAVQGYPDGAFRPSRLLNRGNS